MNFAAKGRNEQNVLVPEGSLGRPCKPTWLDYMCCRDVGEDAAQTRRKEIFPAQPQTLKSKLCGSIPLHRTDRRLNTAHRIICNVQIPSVL